MNTKNIGEATTQKDGKGKTIVTAAAAAVTGAVAGAGGDRLFHDDNKEAAEETTEEGKTVENKETSEEQSNTVQQQVVSNAGGQKASHHGTASHTPQAGGTDAHTPQDGGTDAQTTQEGEADAHTPQDGGTDAHTPQEGGQHTEFRIGQAGNGSNTQAGTNTPTISSEEVETEAVAVAERLVGHEEEPSEVDLILTGNTEENGILYTENGTEIPVEGSFSPNVEASLAELPAEELPDELFEEDGGSLAYIEDANEAADPGLDIDTDIDADIIDI